jgi:aminopeptidase N
VSAPSARAVKRIEDVRQLRQFQFVEDAGPMAHPVRPDQYQAIDNFYTATVYEKGAEVVRMMATLVGRGGFRRGMDLYFQRHDGQAVTCDDFAQAIADANPDSALALRLEGFKRWYAQAGTPRVSASGQFDALAGTYTLTLAQRGPATPGQPEKLPFVIPVALGLIAPDGVALPLQLQGEAAPHGTERVLVLDQSTQTWVFSGLGEPTATPVPSLLRGFSAPVVLDDGRPRGRTACCWRTTTTPSTAGKPARSLALARLLAALPRPTAPPRTWTRPYLQAMRRVLRDEQLDAAFKDLVLTLPSEAYVAERLAEQGVPIDPQRIHAARETMRLQLAQRLHDDWVWAWETHQVQRRLPARPAVRPAGARWPTRHWPCWCWPPCARATRCGPAGPTSV